MTNTSPVNDGNDITTGNTLDDLLHALAQPLTALLFRLELGALNPDPQALSGTLDDARTECLRAINALEEVRRVAHAPETTGDLA